MITIGTFSKTPDGGFRGAIRTLSLSLKTVEIRPVAQTGAKGPSYRVFAGSLEVGAAWTVTRPDKPDSLSVRLDDPSFPTPINALLAQTETGFELRWSRRSRP
ncbi:MAG: hypothetical protein A2790_20070 [Phenylobacterium sp. RIFCSPHIGHO2_01_FULL_69_31]|uniref:DUF736 domain-containing protein n=1 Tax=Phenylobacterium sp. RIFCSPHIGHO2_01_FULL_69_31 TaxID=1801944 RepID=UPI0008B6A2DB|nr:DUF736 domain-containing protein [Phenylobacterium sp. RIFCSPHIGHO2_01_FULL_69_31]OHB26265.1 MAG: hypothetical protein A2790_20070 [Phenylobacterium sp. RIFCSPHIGHO2_01_FULL_69_31]